MSNPTNATHSALGSGSAQCFYCEHPALKVEMDHMPVSKCHGGEDTVPACHVCHTKKDRWGLGRWFNPTQADVDKIPRSAQIMLGLLGRAGLGDGATVCTPEEAREFIASLPAGDWRVFAARVIANGYGARIYQSHEAWEAGENARPWGAETVVAGGRS